MKETKKNNINPNKFKAFATNAATEIYETVTEARIPISSDETVEEARDWVNNGSQL